MIENYRHNGSLAAESAAGVYRQLTADVKTDPARGKDSMGSRVAVCVNEYERLADEVDASQGDIDEQQIARLNHAYDLLIATQATTSRGVALKLKCMARHFAGGEVPANDVEKVAGELTSLVS